MIGTTLLLLMAISTPPDLEPAKEPVPIVSLLKSRRPDWQLQKKEVAGNSVIYDFARGDKWLFVSVTPANSTEAAKDLVERMGRVMTIPPTEIEGVGEICRIWTSPGSETSTLLLQKGTVVVRLVAPSREEAIQLARELDQSLQP